MKTTSLKHRSKDGKLLEATFIPTQGMNLISYKKDGIEVIAQSTQDLFDERLSGLGPIIGPHFYHRKAREFPTIVDTTIFPHLKKIGYKAGEEPFSHGIGRYVPWNITSSDSSVDAMISGIDTYRGITLAALEGFDFEMHFKAQLDSNGLHIKFSVESEGSPSVCGLHYYYAIDDNNAIVTIDSQGEYNDLGEWKSIPNQWHNPITKQVHFDLKNPSDYGFIPPDERHGKALLETKEYHLSIEYSSPTNQNSLQLYHPKDSKFVAIEPISAKNPRNVTALKSSIDVHIDIIPMNKDS